MPKLYQLLLKKVGLWKPPAVPTEESKVFNPIRGAKIGCSMTLDILDYRQYSFVTRKIMEYNVHDMKFSDYLLVARPIGKPDVSVRLRLIPTDNTDDITHRVLLLNLYHEEKFTKELLEAIQDPSKKFIIDDTKNDDDPTNDTHEEYFRVGDVGDSYVTNVKTLSDKNNNGKVDANEVEIEEVEFWDFSRKTKIEGVMVEQYLFIELNKKTGWFQMWQGTEVNPDKIDAI